MNGTTATFRRTVNFIAGPHEQNTALANANEGIVFNAWRSGLPTERLARPDAHRAASKLPGCCAQSYRMTQIGRTNRDRHSDRLKQIRIS